MLKGIKISGLVVFILVLLMPSTFVAKTQGRDFEKIIFKNPKIKVYRGPFNASVLKVIDADTLKVRVFPWPSVAIETSVRLRGIDAPEKKRHKCPEEKQLSKLAIAYTKSIIKPGDSIQIFDVAFGKYSGRVIAGVRIVDMDSLQISLSRALLAAGYAKIYSGGKKESWCQ